MSTLEIEDGKSVNEELVGPGHDAGASAEIERAADRRIVADVNVGVVDLQRTGVQRDFSTVVKKRADGERSAVERDQAELLEIDDTINDDAARRRGGDVRSSNPPSAMVRFRWSNEAGRPGSCSGN